MNKQESIRFAKEVVNTLIKNSDFISPYVRHKDYQKGLIVLNIIHWGLKLWETKEQNKHE